MSNEYDLSMRQFAEINRTRCESAFHPLAAWTLNDYCTALAGEVGEACNVAKKLRRLDDVGAPNETAGDRSRLRLQLADELADAHAYLYLVAARAGIDLPVATAFKFNNVSSHKNCDVMLPEPGRDETRLLDEPAALDSVVMLRPETPIYRGFLLLFATPDWRTGRFVCGASPIGRDVLLPSESTVIDGVRFYASSYDELVPAFRKAVDEHLDGSDPSSMLGEIAEAAESAGWKTASDAFSAASETRSDAATAPPPPAAPPAAPFTPGTSDIACAVCHKPEHLHVHGGIHGACVEFRRRVDDMPRIGVAPHRDVPLGRYRHWRNGDLYDVLGGVFNASEGGDECMVLYQSVKHGYLAARTIEDFTAMCGGSADDGPPRRFELAVDGGGLVAITAEELQAALDSASSHMRPDSAHAAYQRLLDELGGLASSYTIVAESVSPRYVAVAEANDAVDRAIGARNYADGFSVMARFIRGVIADPAKPAEPEALRAPLPKGYKPKARKKT